MLTCKDASRLISEGQDRKLSRREKIGLRLHLWMCDSCRLFEKQMRHLRHALHRGWSGGDLPTDKQLPEEAQERIRKVLKEHSDDSSNSST
ncbi:MAG: zf-HC2 domain-containing protein [gamma proteobacterium endosymbiont of Lamellibrachia anaximandri]|nr:zf-HC2 domain-containing protein [gamma proteobacterium endosymbiont of Lamellibrachia anaximandri]